jgi:hypothetical protein
MPALGAIGRQVSTLGLLALLGPLSLEAQVGLTSEAARIGLIAHVPLRASISGVGSARHIGLRGRPGEEAVKLRLAANTGYRLVVVGTAPVSPRAVPVLRLWVRAENGGFEEIRPGTAVTVVRGRHAAEWQPEVRFRGEGAQWVEGSHVLPVRYEVRIDPAI